MILVNKIEVMLHYKADNGQKTYRSFQPFHGARGSFDTTTAFLRAVGFVGISLAQFTILSVR